MAEDVMGRFCEYVYANVETLTKDVGASKSYLLHAGLSGNGSVATKCAIIKQSTLIRCSSKAKAEKEA